MISIIIITLNEEKYVGHLLSDLANQSEKPYEVKAESDGESLEIRNNFVETVERISWKEKSKKEEINLL